MVTNHNGTQFSTPSTARALDTLVNHPESDGCVIPYDVLVSCGTMPPKRVPGYIAGGVLCLGDGFGRDPAEWAWEGAHDPTNWSHA